MNNKKGVSVILSMILIMGIILISLLITIRWGSPIFETNRALLEINNIKNTFSEINSKISRVALEGNHASRIINLKLKYGNFQVFSEKNLIKYSNKIQSNICDNPDPVEISFSSSTVIPEGIISQSGTVYLANYAFDEYLKELIISDTEIFGNYDTFYVKIDDCYEKYFETDIYLTEKNMNGFLFNGMQNNLGIFVPLGKLENNIYKLCTSGRTFSEISLFLKYKNPELVGNDCESIDIFNHINLSTSTLCVNSCSLAIINKNGDIEIRQV